MFRRRKREVFAVLLLIMLLAGAPGDTATVGLPSLENSRTVVLIDGKRAPDQQVGIVPWSDWPRTTNDCVTTITTPGGKTFAEFDWRAGARVLTILHQAPDDPGDHTPMVLVGHAKASISAGFILARSNKDADDLAAEFKLIRAKCASGSR